MTCTWSEGFKNCLGVEHTLPITKQYWTSSILHRCYGEQPACVSPLWRDRSHIRFWLWTVYPPQHGDVEEDSIQKPSYIEGIQDGSLSGWHYWSRVVSSCSNPELTLSVWVCKQGHFSCLGTNAPSPDNILWGRCARAWSLLESRLQIGMATTMASSPAVCRTPFYQDVGLLEMLLIFECQLPSYVLFPSRLVKSLVVS